MRWHASGSRSPPPPPPPSIRAVACDTAYTVWSGASTVAATSHPLRANLLYHRNALCALTRARVPAAAAAAIHCTPTCSFIEMRCVRWCASGSRPPSPPSIRAVACDTACTMWSGARTVAAASRPRGSQSQCRSAARSPTPTAPRSGRRRACRGPAQSLHSTGRRAQARRGRVGVPRTSTVDNKGAERRHGPRGTVQRQRRPRRGSCALFMISIAGLRTVFAFLLWSRPAARGSRHNHVCT